MPKNPMMYLFNTVTEKITKQRLVFTFQERFLGLRGFIVKQVLPVDQLETLKQEDDGVMWNRRKG